MYPSISLLGTLDIHRRDQAVLRPEEDTEGIRKMNRRAVNDAQTNAKESKKESNASC
jgi:hypothetical protein